MAEIVTVCGLVGILVVFLAAGPWTAPRAKLALAVTLVATTLAGRAVFPENGDATAWLSVFFTLLPLAVVPTASIAPMLVMHRSRRWPFIVAVAALGCGAGMLMALEGFYRTPIYRRDPLLLVLPTAVCASCAAVLAVGLQRTRLPAR